MAIYEELLLSAGGGIECPAERARGMAAWNKEAMTYLISLFYIQFYPPNERPDDEAVCTLKQQVFDLEETEPTVDGIYERLIGRLTVLLPEEMQSPNLHWKDMLQGDRELLAYYHKQMQDVVEALTGDVADLSLEMGNRFYEAHWKCAADSARGPLYAYRLIAGAGNLLELIFCLQSHNDLLWGEAERKHKAARSSMDAARRKFRKREGSFFESDSKRFRTYEEALRTEKAAELQCQIYVLLGNALKKLESRIREQAKETENLCRVIRNLEKTFAENVAYVRQLPDGREGFPNYSVIEAMDAKLDSEENRSLLENSFNMVYSGTIHDTNRVISRAGTFVRKDGTIMARNRKLLEVFLEKLTIRFLDSPAFRQLFSRLPMNRVSKGPSTAATTQPRKGTFTIRKAKRGEKYIFISYAHKDANQVLPILERMTRDGYVIWYDDHIVPVSEWDDMIAEHLVNAEYVVAFLSRNYMDSENCRDELKYAKDKAKKPLLIYLEEVCLQGGLDMRLSRVQHLNRYEYGNEEAFYEKLYEARGIDVCKV